VLVVLGAADLVGRLGAELADVEGVEADLGVRNAFFGADRFLIAGGHVDRDRPDRRLLLACERVEERLQAVRVAALGGPHDPAAVVVSDAGQELVIGAVADLVHADQLEAVQPAGGQLLGDDTREDLPNGLPADPHQPGDLRLTHLLRQPRRQILEIAGVPRTRPCPRHVLVHIAAARAVQPPQPALDHAPQAAEIKMPPRLLAVPP
jgi:hypothetical protein